MTAKKHKFLKKSGSDYESLSELEKRFVTAKILDPVVSDGQIKDAVIDIIENLENNEDTHFRCLYILMTLSNPFLSYDDMLFLQYRDWQRRLKRRVKFKIQSYAYTALGLSVSSFIFYLVNSFGA